MFKKGQTVFLDCNKVIDYFLRKNPSLTRNRAIYLHRKFFTQVIPNIYYFIVAEEENPFHEGIRIKMVWKGQIPHGCHWIDTVMVPKECLVLKETNFIHLMYYV